MTLATSTPITFVQTRDRAKAKEFYANALGVRPLGFDGFAEVFDLAGTPLRITELPDWRANSHPVLGWTVADIAASVHALSAKGVKFEIYDGMGQDKLGIWTSPDGKAKVAFFKDPDGNILSLTQ